MRFEVVIIGAGIAGISTAYSLQKRGVTNVLVIDKGGVNAGSTTWAAGIVSHLFRRKLELDLIGNSIKVFKEIEKESTGHFSYHQIGMLSVGRKRHEQRLLQALETVRQMDVAANLLDRQSITELVPEIIGDDLKLGIHCMESGYLDQALFTGVTADLLESRGVSIIEGGEVHGIIIGRDREVKGIDTSQGPIASEKVVIAGGVWSKSIGERAGLSLPISMQKAQSMTLLLQKSMHIPVFFDLTSEIYMRPVTDTVILVGNGSKPFRGKIDNYSPRAESRFMNGLKLRLSSRFKHFNDSKILDAWSGLYSSTPDGLPLVGESNRARGLFYLCAFQGLGIMFAPGSAGLVSDVIVGKSSREILPFRAERFRGGLDRTTTSHKHWSQELR